MKIVNIIPQSMSAEAHQDSGPSIAVNPRNTNEIVISTLTPDPNGGPNAPVFVSTDGGDTWSLKSIVPGNGPTGTNGMTLKYGQTSNQLYAGVLKGTAWEALDILRTTNPIGGATMTELDATQTSVEQPYIAVATVPNGPDGGKDRLYIGMNVLQYNTFANPSDGKTSTIRQTMDAQAAAPVFTSISLDRRDKSIPAFQDGPVRNGPQVRPAVHHDGTVYAGFYSWKTWADPGDGNGLVTSDIVIVRDDNWGQSGDPYGSLIDSGDGQAGQRIAIDVPIQFYSALGQEHIGGELAIAVDPGNSSIVYVAWAEIIDDGGGGEIDVYMVHLRRSTDRGQTWSPLDLLSVPDGKNPALAINDSGQVGFLYQQLTGLGNSQRWETHLAFSGNAVHWSDTVLATVPAATPVRQFFPYIGDYADMMTVGDTFYGVFCANNKPDVNFPAIHVDFPQGAIYQRNNVDGVLLNTFGQAPVPPSIDPFFIKTGFIAPPVQVPPPKWVGIVIIILFGIIGDGGGAYIDGSGHIHIVGPGDPGPVLEYLVSLAEYRLATALNSKAGLEMQKLALQNVIDLASAQIAQINGQIGGMRGQ
jgi:hypothetical protein